MVVLPIVDRELRVAARRPSTYWLRCAAAGAVLLIFIVLLLNSQTSPKQMGRHLLNALGVLALGFSLLAGVFLTADCLAEEKREGTLGLLFLTDLKSYDIVFGKLAANSLHACFGLLAIFPILGLSLLVGGVTGGEFARSLLSFGMALFLSLGVGMLVSAISHETKHALVTALFLMVLLAGILPALWWGLWLFFKMPTFDFLLWPSPAYAYMKGFDDRYRFGGGPHEYWMSIGTIAFLALACLLASNVLLPHSWRQGNASLAGSWWRKFRPTRAVTLPDWRRPRVGSEPMYWLMTRDASTRRSAIRLLVILAPFWFAFWLASLFTSQFRSTFIICLFIACAMHLVVKILVMVESSRRLNEDRRSGALELLLATPLEPRAILKGQKRALRKLFRGPVITLIVMNVTLWGTTLMFHRHLTVSSQDRLIFSELFAGGIMVLLLDFIAAGWVGMCNGLQAGKHHHAVMRTIGQIMVIPWLMIFLLAALVQGFASAMGAFTIFGLWFVLGVTVDLVTARWARTRLESRFRAMAAGEV
jgi:ABC-type transport system involved in multi-copper enzyme maturation permease subunit